MKKIFLMMMCGLFIAIPAFGTNMCVDDDTVAVVLDPSQNGTSGGQSPLSTGTGEWNVTFAWGRVYGVSACLSANYGAALDEITDNGAIVVGREINGIYCYCRMTHPAASRWVFRFSRSDCASICAFTCYNFKSGYGHGVLDDAYVREVVFGSIAE